MSETKGLYNVEPMPEPVFNTVAEIEKATAELCQWYRANGWPEGLPEQEAAEFYGHHLTKLHLRELEAKREIEVVCAWCPDHTHISGPVGAPPERVSHGICKACKAKLDEEMGEEVLT